MKIRLETTPELRQEVERLALFFERLLKPTQAERERVAGAVRAGFDENFATESAGGIPWPRLAESTARERRRLGFGAYHPILRRTGSLLDSYVNAGNAEHLSEFEQRSDGWTLAEGSSDQRVPWLSGGTTHIPARPVEEIGGRGERRIQTTLDDIFNSIQP